jgi:hypothetical protein
MDKKLIKSIIIILLFLITILVVNTNKPHITVVEGGVIEEKIDNIQPWYVNISDYVGNYHYGFSETESELILKYDKNVLNASIESRKFTEDGTQVILLNIPLNNAKIEGNKFYSDKWNGEFVSFIVENKNEHGLKLYGFVESKPSEPIMDEIGFLIK